MPSRTLRVFLADDHPLLRLALRLSLTQESDVEVVGEAGDGYSAVKSIQACLPDIVVIDVEMPGLSGIRAVRILRKILPETKIIVLSTYNKEEFIRKAIQAGADGYVVKRVGIADLVRIIKAFGTGESIVSPYLANLTLGHDSNRVIAEDDERPVLTSREKQVLQELVEGKSYKEISNILSISTETVKSHMKKIYGKLDVKNRLEATKIASQMNLLD